MQSKLYCKILAIGIICLFIGVGIHPAFAVEDKASSSEKENSIISSGEVYENSNCFIRGWASDSIKANPSGNFNWPFFKGDICFGSWWAGGGCSSAFGSIYTISLYGKWKCEGGFHGEKGYVDLFYWTTSVTYYIGIKCFRGIAFGGKFAQTHTCWFIGFADSVKIETGDPCL